MSIGSCVETGVWSISGELSPGELSRFSYFFFFSFTKDGGVLSLTDKDRGEMSLLFSFFFFHLFAGEPIISRGVYGSLLFEGGANCCFFGLLR